MARVCPFQSRCGEEGRQRGEEANRSADDVRWFAIELPHRGPIDREEAGRAGIKQEGKKDHPIRGLDIKLSPR